MELEPQHLTWHDVFVSGPSGDPYLRDFVPAAPITFFVGPNGSGKTKTAFAYARRVGTNSRRLSTDRLVGVMNFTHYGSASIPLGGSRGVPIGGTEEQQLRSMAPQGGIINDAFYILRDNPDVYLRVNAVLSRISFAETCVCQKALDTSSPPFDFASRIHTRSFKTKATGFAS